MQKMKNATLENYRTQCDSFVVVFPKRGTYKEVINAETGAVLETIDLSIVEVPDRLAPLLAEQMKSKGVFIVPNNPAEFEEAERKALINYLNGRLRTRRNNYLLQKDEFERKGATFQFSEEFEEAIRWDREIRHILNQQRPIRDSGSFLEHYNAAPMPAPKEQTESKEKFPVRKTRGRSQDLGITMVEEANG